MNLPRKLVLERHMRFALVNGRSPREDCFCVMCEELIGASYLREVGTKLVYCDQNCYADHCQSAALALANDARAS
jgi:hypothetical protein